MASTPSDKIESFAEAVKSFRKRVPISAEKFAELDDEAKTRAFSVAGIAQADLVNDVWQGIDSAIENGTTLEDFKDAVGDQLESAWGTEDPARIETIFRTNVMTAYNNGRNEIISDPDVKESHPYWVFDAIEDDRISDICESIAGTTLPADDPFWASHVPPLHFNCRSTIIPLSDEDAKAEEGYGKGAPDTQASEGFGVPQPIEESETDPSDFPPEIADRLADKIG